MSTCATIQRDIIRTHCSHDAVLTSKPSFHTNFSYNCSNTGGSLTFFRHISYECLSLSVTGPTDPGTKKYQVKHIQIWYFIGAGRNDRVNNIWSLFRPSI